MVSDQEGENKIIHSFYPSAGSPRVLLIGSCKELANKTVDPDQERRRKTIVTKALTTMEAKLTNTNRRIQLLRL